MFKSLGVFGTSLLLLETMPGPMDYLKVLAPKIRGYVPVVEYDDEDYVPVVDQDSDEDSKDEYSRGKTGIIRRLYDNEIQCHHQEREEK